MLKNKVSTCVYIYIEVLFVLEQRQVLANWAISKQIVVDLQFLLGSVFLMINLIIGLDCQISLS